MPTDRGKSAKPLFDDPFAALDDTEKTDEASVKPKAGSRKGSPAKSKRKKKDTTAVKSGASTRKRTTKKASSKPKSEEKPAAATKPKKASRKRSTKKTTSKAKPKEKPATAAKPKTAERKRTTKKTTSKAKPKQKPATAAKPKKASRKRTTKKTTSKAKPKEKPEAAAKPKTAARKRTTKKTTSKAKPKQKPATAAKPKTAARKRTTKKTTSKAKPKEKPATTAKPKTAERKRTAKKTESKPKREEKSTAAAKPETEVEETSSTETKPVAFSTTRKEKEGIDSRIADKDLPGDRTDVESSHEFVFDPDKGQTLLETLIASIDEGDEKAMERAQMAALPFVRQIEAIEGEQHVIFTLAEGEYAVSIDNVVEIGEPLNTAPVPNVPEWVLGVANLRGDIVSVVDLRTFMGLPEASLGQEKRMLVARSNDGEVSSCVVVDQVRGIRYLNMDQLEQPTVTVTDLIAEFIDGVCNNEGQVLTVLDFDRMLSSERMQIS